MTTTDSFSLSEMRVSLGGRTLIHGAHAQFELGQLHAVIGRSGAGKSVLMKAALGLLPLEAGHIALRSSSLGDVLVKHGDRAGFGLLRRRVVFVHQDPALLDDLTVAENVCFAAERLALVGGREHAAQWIDHLSLGGLVHLKPRALSPSALRRVALARALATRPEVLIVDEPTTGLHPQAAREVDRALATLKATGTTLIVITHDLRSLALLCPSLCWVQEGEVKWQGSYPERFGQDPVLDALVSGLPFTSPTPDDDHAPQQVSP